CGLPQLRLRDGRRICQAGPGIGSETGPARNPSKKPPIERGGPGNGVDLRANSSLAGVDGASGFCSGGRGLGLSEPGGVGSIKCFSCATAEPTAARNRTASRRVAARISNYVLTVVGEQWSARAPPNNTPIDIVTAMTAQLRQDFQGLAMSAMGS